MRKTLFILTFFYLTTSCSQKGKNDLGLTQTIPDEYKSTRNKPLEVPPAYQKRAN